MKNTMAPIQTLLEEELTELKAKHLYRQIRPLSSHHGVKAKMEGREITLFCGNDYLGLSAHPRVKNAFQETAKTAGVGVGAARLISGTSDIHRALEEKIASFKSQESALLFSTGYLANLGILTALAGPEDVIVMDKLCHASLIDGARLSGAAVRVFPHLNYERCESILKNASSFRRRLIVSETIFSMDGDLADLKELIRLKEAYECFLIVDEAHATGVLGKTGRGAAEGTGYERKIDVLMGTLSKAIGCIGGFAAGSQTMMEYLTNFSRPFIFETALPTAVCAAALEALNTIEEEPQIKEKLWERIQKLKNIFQTLGISGIPVKTPIVPIILGSEERTINASEKLLEAGFFVPAIRPPTVAKGKARLRLTLSALHEDHDLEKIAQIIAKLLK